MTETPALLRTFLALLVQDSLPIGTVETLLSRAADYASDPRPPIHPHAAMYGADLAARLTGDTFGRDNASVGEDG